MALTPQWLDELRARTSLSALIGRSIKVTKTGREYKACCPFHNEKTPSFTINDEKGFYHCFGCSAHGDAIRWMTDQRGLSFMDAVKELADNAGMEVPAPDPRAAKVAEERAGLHDVMAAAQDYFVKAYKGIEGAGASAYLKKRGLRDDIIEQFGFGFAPDSRTALRNALKQFGDPMLIEAGMLIKVDDKEPYDRFRGRLMIPIRDARGRVIAFGGRILGDGEPKYLNSPDTPLFDKGRTLYNLNICSPASRNTGRVIVVEGYMDVIALAQAGYPDVVAPLGTALTEQQIQMLWRMAEKPIICFDGDKAGQKAAIRAAMRALPDLVAGSSLKFAKLPPGQDPDDVLKTNGSIGTRVLNGFLDSAESLSDFLWRNENAKVTNSSDPDDRAALLKRLEDIAKTIKDDIVSKEYFRSLRTYFYDVYGFRKEGMQKLSSLISDTIDASSQSKTDIILRAILLGLSRYPKIIKSKLEKIGALKIESKILAEMRWLLVETVLAQPDVEQDMIEQIWATNLATNFSPRDLQKDFAFSFYKKHDDPAKAESDLFSVIDLFLRERELASRLIHTLEIAAINVDDKSYDEYRAVEIERAKLFQDLQDAMEVRLTGT